MTGTSTHIKQFLFLAYCWASLIWILIRMSRKLNWRVRLCSPYPSRKYCIWYRYLHACKLSSLLFWWGTRLIIHELLMETVFDTLWDQSATMEASELYLFKINSWRQKNPNQILNKPMQLYRLLLNNKLLILYRKSWSFNYRSLCYGGRCHCLTMCMGDKMSAADISVADADILRRRQHGLYTKQ